MEKNMENEMESTVYRATLGLRGGWGSKASRY